MSGARIGDSCILGQNVFVDRGVRIGRGCKIQNNVSVYAGVTLEEEVFCGPSCVFTNVRTPRAFVERKDEFAPTRVCRGATIGANATIVCGVTLGAYSFVAAGAVVRSDVPPYRVVAGVPAREIGYACACGEILREGRKTSPSNGQEVRCGRCGSAYRLAPDGVFPIPPA